MAALSTIMSNIAPNLLPKLKGRITLIKTSGHHSVHLVQYVRSSIENYKDKTVVLHIHEDSYETSDTNLPNNIMTVEDKFHTKVPIVNGLLKSLIRVLHCFVK